jgi:hypothetical protein
MQLNPVLQAPCTHILQKLYNSHIDSIGLSPLANRRTQRTAGRDESSVQEADASYPILTWDGCR